MAVFTTAMSYYVRRLQVYMQYQFSVDKSAREVDDRWEIFESEPD